MTYREIVAQAKELPLDEQWLVVKELLDALKMETLAANGRVSAEARQRRLAALPPASVLLGIIKPEGHIPTDEEIKEDYVNYLIRKYS